MQKAQYLFPKKTLFNWQVERMKKNPHRDKKSVRGAKFNESVYINSVLCQWHFIYFFERLKQSC